MVIDKKQNMHPLIKYIEHWEAYNIKARRSANVQLMSSIAGVLSFTLLIALLLS
ncbi:MAG: hypothetical protein WBA74_23750 [Cyclobacteriaceae bacterium]